MGSVNAPIGHLVDPSRGERAFVIQQVGMTALLAGRLREALALLEKALVAPVPPSLAFIHRDAHLRVALIHALYGDPAHAQARLEAATQVPRTRSWAEDVLDTDETLVRTLLRPGCEAAAALESLCHIPVAAMQEMQPLHIVATNRLGLIVGEARKVNARIDEIEAVGVLGTTGTGLTGSVIGHSRALLAMLAGASTRSEQILATTDPDLWQTMLIAGTQALARGNAARAANLARAAADQTAGLQQAENLRLMVLAVAHTLNGDHDASTSVLTDLAPVLDVFTHALLRNLAPRVARRASETVPGWPPATEEIPAVGALDHRQLTDRELDVLRGLASGGSREEIARELYITVNTVKTHQRSLYRKLGATTKHEAIREARRRVLLRAPRRGLQPATRPIGPGAAFGVYPDLRRGGASLARLLGWTADLPTISTGELRCPTDLHVYSCPPRQPPRRCSSRDAPTTSLRSRRPTCCRARREPWSRSPNRSTLGESTWPTPSGRSPSPAGRTSRSP